MCSPDGTSYSLGEVAKDDASISDNEIVLRRVPDGSYTFDENLGRVRLSTQVFLQDGTEGLVSVYLESETSHAVVAAEGPEPYLVSLSVGELRRVKGNDPGKLGIVRDPSSGGPGHCVITGRKTQGRRNQLAKQAQRIPGYAPPSVSYTIFLVGCPQCRPPLEWRATQNLLREGT